MSSHPESQEPASHFDDLVQTRLPLSKVKKIAKIDPNVHMINAESVKLMSMGAEAFISLLAKAAFTQAVLDKRKTIQTKDIDTVIRHSPVFQLLQGALDGWPEPERVERAKTPREGEEAADTVEEAEDAVEEGEEDTMEEEAEDAVENEGEDTVENEEENVDETAEDNEEGDHSDDDSATENETEEEMGEDEDKDKENEFRPVSGDTEMPDTVLLKESTEEDLPDTVPLVAEMEEN